jgi:tetratricopeptide (TPR) repeat protein
VVEQHELSPLGQPLIPVEESESQSARIRSADEALASDPDSVDLMVEAALAREEVWRYREAIELYTKGLAIAPDDYRLPLGRAHRLIRLRRFAEALDDLNRSAELDPYGFNTAYLRGLTHYLRGEFDRAADEYGRCMAWAQDDDALALVEQGKVPGDPRHCMLIATDDRTRVAITGWRYRALRRAGRDREAAQLLDSVTEGLSLTDPGAEDYQGSTIKPDSNAHYYRTLLFYKGLLTEEDILDKEALGGQWSTVAYGVAVFHLVEGNKERAVALMREVVAEPYWARFGHVAAETDLLRLGAAEE